MFSKHVHLRVCVSTAEHKELCPMGPGYGPDGMGKHIHFCMREFCFN